MKAWDQAFSNQLLAAPDYRTFLRTFFERSEPARVPKPLSFQEFAMRAGFSSKAFLNDVIARRKRLTPTSIEKTAAGLGLNSKWLEYFQCLVALEESSCRSPKQSAEYFQQKVQRLKKKLERTRKVTRLETKPDLVRVFLDRDFPEVYASLGDTNNGETLGVIAKRAHLSEEKTLYALRRMITTGLVKQSGDRFVPLMEALEADGLRCTQVFREDFFRALEKARARFSTQAESQSSLFMTQTVSVSLAHLPRLRKQLAEVIEAFADEAEVSNGDAVGEVCLSFTHNRQ